MNRRIFHFYTLLAHLSGPGLILLGALDSSFLFVPFGNDLLVIVLSARRHVWMPYYAVMAAAGLVYWLCDYQRGGTEGRRKRA